jgi:hypothetical protein
MVEITIRKRAHEDAVITQRKFFKKTARGKVVKGACLLLFFLVEQLDPHYYCECYVLEQC